MQKQHVITINQVQLHDLYQLAWEQANKLQALTEKAEKTLTTPVKSISKWSAVEHIEHLIYTCRTTALLLEETLIKPPPNPKGTLNTLGSALFKRGRIPRGETQAPDFAIPKGMPLKKIKSSLGRFLKQLQAFQTRIKDLEQCNGKTKHPVLGYFSPFHWFQFLCMHQQHHLEIITEILENIEKHIDSEIERQ